MFAWILNTKPETFGSVGAIGRSRAGCGRGGGASFATPCEQLAHAEVVHGAAEEHRRLVAREVHLEIELRAQPAHHRDVLAQLRDRGLGQQLVELRIVEAGDLDALLEVLALACAPSGSSWSANRS